jgi:hypothetical protein
VVLTNVLNTEQDVSVLLQIPEASRHRRRSLRRPRVMRT